jgi:type IV pilus assembly protein PilM
MFSLGKKTVIGLDIGSSTVKAVELEPHGGSFRLRAMGYASLPPEAIVQGSFMNAPAISSAISEACAMAGFKSKEVVTSVSGHSVIVKRISLPAQSKEELEETIRWEAEQYIPVDINEVNIDHQILRETGVDGQMDVLLVAAKKDLIDYISVITESGLSLVVMDATRRRRQHTAQLRPADDTTVALLDLGASVINMNVMQGSAPVFTRDITSGGNQYRGDPEDARHHLRGGRAHQGRRPLRRGQQGRGAAGSRRGHARGLRGHARRDPALARLLSRHRRELAHRGAAALRRRGARAGPRPHLPRPPRDPGRDRQPVPARRHLVERGRRGQHPRVRAFAVYGDRPGHAAGRRHVIRINLLPVREARRAANMRKQGVFMAGAAGAGVAISLILSMWMTARISRERALITARETELKKLEEVQKEVKRFQAEQQEIEQKLAVIDQIEAQRTGPVKIMDELAQRIPQRVWLTGLTASGGMLEIQGHSLDAEIVADFAAALEESPMLSGVDLRESNLVEIDGLKLAAFMMTAQYPFLKAPDAEANKKAVRRGAPAKPAAHGAK